MAKNKEVFRLSPSERKKVEKRRKRVTDTRIYRRMSALLWLDGGRSQEDVAELLSVEARTVRRWVKEYRKSGLEGLSIIRLSGSKCRLTEPQLAAVKEQVEAGTFRNAKQARNWIAEQFQVCYSLTAVKDLLRSLGATYHRTTPFLFKADPEKQKKFATLPATETPEQFDTSVFSGWSASGVGSGTGP